MPFWIREFQKIIFGSKAEKLGAADTVKRVVKSDLFPKDGLGQVEVVNASTVKQHEEQKTKLTVKHLGHNQISDSLRRKMIDLNFKQCEPRFGLFTYEDLAGDKRLSIGKYNKSRLPVEVFTTRDGGIHKLHELVKRFGLCASLCWLGSCEPCGMVDKWSDLLCTANEPPEIYNSKVVHRHYLS